MKKLVLSFAALLCLAVVAFAQDETNTGVAPTIESITPNEITIVGNGFAVVEVTYADPNLDANRFIWSTEADDAERWSLPDTFFSQTQAGTTLPIRFVCDDVTASVEIVLVVADLAGNESEPATLQLNCESSTPEVETTAVPEVPPEVTESPEATSEITPEAAESTVDPIPQILSLEPSAAILIDGQSIDATITYADGDGDASSLIFSTVDDGNWSLPPTFFSQAVDGTSLPLNFFCEDVFVTLPVDIQIVVVDEAANVSEPVTFRLTCLPEGVPVGNG